MATMEDMLRSFAQLSSAPAELPALGKVGGAFDRQVFLLRCEEEDAACNRPATSYLLTGILAAARKAGDAEWARRESWRKTVDLTARVLSADSANRALGPPPLMGWWLGALVGWQWDLQIVPKHLQIKQDSWQATWHHVCLLP